MRTRWKNKLLQRKYDRGMADSSSWWAENREQIWLGAQTLPLLQSSSTPSTSGSMGGKLQWTRYRHLHLTSTLSSHRNGMWIKRGWGLCSGGWQPWHATSSLWGVSARGAGDGTGRCFYVPGEGDRPSPVSHAACGWTLQKGPAAHVSSMEVEEF